MREGNALSRAFMVGYREPLLTSEAGPSKAGLKAGEIFPCRAAGLSCSAGRQRAAASEAQNAVELAQP